MSVRKSTTFLLSDLFEDEITSSKRLGEITAKYQDSLTETTYQIPTENPLEFMLAAKRTKITFGPYQNLSFFEISNRIYSDLVLLSAAKILFEEHQILSVYLKMSNHAGKDLIAKDNDGNSIEGEAFNTATTFFQVKMRSELKKFDKEKAGFIAFNKTALVGNEGFFENRKHQYPNITFIICDI